VSVPGGPYFLDQRQRDLPFVERTDQIESVSERSDVGNQLSGEVQGRLALVLDLFVLPQMLSNLRGN